MLASCFNYLTFIINMRNIRDCNAMKYDVPLLIELQVREGERRECSLSATFIP
jgi:hypothetical protein